MLQSICETSYYAQAGIHIEQDITIKQNPFISHFVNFMMDESCEDLFKAIYHTSAITRNEWFHRLTVTYIRLNNLYIRLSNSYI